MEILTFKYSKTTDSWGLALLPYTKPAEHVLKDFFCRDLSGDFAHQVGNGSQVQGYQIL